MSLHYDDLNLVSREWRRDLTVTPELYGRPRVYRARQRKQHVGWVIELTVSLTALMTVSALLVLAAYTLVRPF